VENKIVKTLCGDYPIGFSKEDILSNPNFIFKNDLAYPPTTLLDAEKNVVTVNSFIECEHYVSGGWNYLPQVITESQYHLYIAAAVVIFLIVEIAIKRIRGIKKFD
jgi:hypothetical protein